MTEDRFWQLIDESRRGFDPRLRDGNMDRQRAALETLLAALPTEEIEDFGRIFRSVFDRAYRWDLWGAAFVIGSGCSDDWFDYFRFWLISMGRQVYDEALGDPESLAEASGRPGVEDIFFEDFGYVDGTVLEQRGVEDSDDGYLPPAEPAGERWAEQDLPHRFPRLWAKYGNRGTK